MNTANINKAIATASFVLVTLPPVEKFVAGRGYYKIELRDQNHVPYGKAYHTKSLDTAKALAAKIAHDRKAEIVTIEANIPMQAATAVAEKPARFIPNDKPPMLEVPSLDENGEIVD